MKARDLKLGNAIWVGDNGGRNAVLITITHLVIVNHDGKAKWVDISGIRSSGIRKRKFRVGVNHEFELSGDTDD